MRVGGVEGREGLGEENDSSTGQECNTIPL